MLLYPKVFIVSNTFHGLSIRGDCVYCPLAVSIDSYWNCLTDCHHCYLRKLNQTWGQDLRPLDTEWLRRKMEAGLKASNPQSPVAWALANKKTLRWGNKSDPFQTAEREHRIAPAVFRTLIDLEWTFVIQTRFTDVLADYWELLLEANEKHLVTVMPVISPGLERDWTTFERERTTNPYDRLKFCSWCAEQGIPVGVNGEPFIPGFHEVRDFEYMMKLLVHHGVPSYNTYNLHLNDYVVKRFAEIGMDFETIWKLNKDTHWKTVLPQLLSLGKQYGIRIGSPDFVNSGNCYVEQANTCCGIHVPNPCTFNTHHWKQLIQSGLPPETALNQTWDGVGDWETGNAVCLGSSKDYFTIRDSGVLG